MRHLAVVTPLGGERFFLQLPAHLKTYGHPGATWMAWYLRALGRMLGLPSARVDRPYLREYLKHMQMILTRQVKYHTNSEHSNHLIEHRLHTLGLVTLGLTLAACFLHAVPLIVKLSHLEHVALAERIAHTLHLPGVSLWLTFLCGFLPALGASLVGITNQGEFRRMAMRSKAMAQQLADMEKAVCAQLAALAQPNVDDEQQVMKEALALADQTARALVSEVLDWRVVFVDRPLTPPG